MIPSFSMFFATFAFTIVSSSVVSGQPFGFGGSINKDPQQALDEARLRWDANNITDYDYRYAQQCRTCDLSISRSKKVLVRNGTIIDVEYSFVSNLDNSTESIVPEEAVAAVKDVPMLFDILQEAIDINASSITADYDRNYGHPTYISIDYDDSVKEDEFNARIESLIDARVTETRQKELDAAIALWWNQGTADYNYYYQRSCLCMMDYTRRMLVEVRNSTVTGGYFADDGTEAPADMVDGWLQTVDDLFTTIQSAIDRQSYSTQVTYNGTFGYPMDINIDYNPMIADEELYVTTDGLEIISEEVEVDTTTTVGRSTGALAASDPEPGSEDSGSASSGVDFPLRTALGISLLSGISILLCGA